MFKFDISPINSNQFASKLQLQLPLYTQVYNLHQAKVCFTLFVQSMVSIFILHWPQPMNSRTLPSNKQFENTDACCKKTQRFGDTALYRLLNELTYYDVRTDNYLQRIFFWRWFTWASSISWNTISSKILISRPGRSTIIWPLDYHCLRSFWVESHSYFAWYMVRLAKRNNDINMKSLSNFCNPFLYGIPPSIWLPPCWTFVNL